MDNNFFVGTFGVLLFIVYFATTAVDKTNQVYAVTLTRRCQRVIDKFQKPIDFFDFFQISFHIFAINY